MYSLKNFFGHLHTILNHKKLVRHYCFKAGLYRQGIMHDWSKYSPVEFKIGVKYYQGGKRSPNYGEIKDKGFSTAWLHHKGRNKHHFEYWIDVDHENPTRLKGMKMETKYVIEMFCDRISASRNYHPDLYTDGMPLDYYNKNKDHYTIHPDTEKLLVFLLKMLKAKGEDYTFRYIRKKILKNTGFFGILKGIFL
ncbi:MAG: DUF5662 family protein [Lachnospiraceae bacterium]|nr:DUF5662 family protein [Lachnospiraceae bacterium]